MIEVYGRNRLGNILFLYAVGRQLAIKNGTGLRLHLVGRNARNSSIRDQLSHFNLQAEILIADSDAFKEPLDTTNNNFSGNVFVETEWGFNPQVLTLKDGVHLFGNFQCEKYFTAIDHLIRQDLKIKDCLLDKECASYLEKIKTTNSVAVHVRRGDYLNLELHDVCNRKYYANSIEYMDANLNEPHFFIFSDDIDWCVKNFDSRNCSFVDIAASKRNPVIDFNLMTRCNHYIIANSSFSWWPAWLNPNRGKVIVGPKYWFKNEHKLDWVICQDTIPEHWVRIDF